MGHVAGTGPTDGESAFCLQIAPEPAIGDEFKLEWAALRGRLYSIFEKTHLNEPWSPEPTVQFRGNGATMSYSSTRAERRGVFRITVEMDR